MVRERKHVQMVKGSLSPTRLRKPIQMMTKTSVIKMESSPGKQGPDAALPNNNNNNNTKDQQELAETSSIPSSHPSVSVSSCSGTTMSGSSSSVSFHATAAAAGTTNIRTTMPGATVVGASQRPLETTARLRQKIIQKHAAQQRHGPASHKNNKKKHVQQQQQQQQRDLDSREPSLATASAATTPPTVAPRVVVSSSSAKYPPRASSSTTNAIRQKLGSPLGRQRMNQPQKEPQQEQEQEPVESYKGITTDKNYDHADNKDPHKETDMENDDDEDDPWVRHHEDDLTAADAATVVTGWDSIRSKLVAQQQQQQRQTPQAQPHRPETTGSSASSSSRSGTTTSRSSKPSSSPKPHAPPPLVPPQQSPQTSMPIRGLPGGGPPSPTVVDSQKNNTNTPHTTPQKNRPTPSVLWTVSSSSSSCSLEAFLVDSATVLSQEGKPQEKEEPQEKEKERQEHEIEEPEAAATGPACSVLSPLTTPTALASVVVGTTHTRQPRNNQHPNHTAAQVESSVPNDRPPQEGRDDDDDEDSILRLSHHQDFLPPQPDQDEYSTSYILGPLNSLLEEDDHESKDPTAPVLRPPSQAASLVPVEAAAVDQREDAKNGPYQNDSYPRDGSHLPQELYAQVSDPSAHILAVAQKMYRLNRNQVPAAIPPPAEQHHPFQVIGIPHTIQDPSENREPPEALSEPKGPLDPSSTTNRHQTRRRRRKATSMKRGEHSLISSSSEPSASLQRTTDHHHSSADPATRPKHSNNKAKTARSTSTSRWDPESLVGKVIGGTLYHDPTSPFAVKPKDSDEEDETNSEWTPLLIRPAGAATTTTDQGHASAHAADPSLLAKDGTVPLSSAPQQQEQDQHPSEWLQPEGRSRSLPTIRLCGPGRRRPTSFRSSATTTDAAMAHYHTGKHYPVHETHPKSNKNPPKENTLKREEPARTAKENPPVERSIHHGGYQTVSESSMEEGKASEDDGSHHGLLVDSQDTESKSYLVLKDGSYRHFMISSLLSNWLMGRKTSTRLVSEPMVGVEQSQQAKEFHDHKSESEDRLLQSMSYCSAYNPSTTRQKPTHSPGVFRNAPTMNRDNTVEAKEGIKKQGKGASNVQNHTVSAEVEEPELQNDDPTVDPILIIGTAPNRKDKAAKSRNHLNQAQSRLFQGLLRVRSSNNGRRRDTTTTNPEDIQQDDDLVILNPCTAVDSRRLLEIERYEPQHDPPRAAYDLDSSASLVVLPRRSRSLPLVGQKTRNTANIDTSGSLEEAADLAVNTAVLSSLSVSTVVSSIGSMSRNLPNQRQPPTSTKNLSLKSLWQRRLNKTANPSQNGMRDEPTRSTTRRMGPRARSSWKKPVSKSGGGLRLWRPRNSGDNMTNLGRRGQDKNKQDDDDDDMLDHEIVLHLVNVDDKDSAHHGQEKGRQDGSNGTGSMTPIQPTRCMVPSLVDHHAFIKSTTTAAEAAAAAWSKSIASHPWVGFCQPMEGDDDLNKGFHHKQLQVLDSCKALEHWKEQQQRQSFKSPTIRKNVSFNLNANATYETENNNDDHEDRSVVVENGGGGCWVGPDNGWWAQQLVGYAVMARAPLLFLLSATSVLPNKSSHRDHDDDDEDSEDAASEKEDEESSQDEKEQQEEKDPEEEEEDDEDASATSPEYFGQEWNASVTAACTKHPSSSQDDLILAAPCTIPRLRQPRQHPNRGDRRHRVVTPPSSSSQHQVTLSSRESPFSQESSAVASRESPFRFPSTSASTTME